MLGGALSKGFQITILPSGKPPLTMALMKQHILVVDDEAPIRELLQTYFKKHGYNVTTAETAAEAFRLADEVPLHLIVLDIVLADADGMEVLATIKSAHPKLPVIVMTGMGFDEELLQEAIQKGASGYVSKTLPLDQLLMEVHRTLNYR
jgi:DNA-binding NtrC family response regulator